MSKDLGWGWVPISWEGWAVIAISFVGILAAMLFSGVMDVNFTVGKGIQLLISLLLVIALAAFVSSRKTKP